MLSRSVCFEPNLARAEMVVPLDSQSLCRPRARGVIGTTHSCSSAATGDSSGAVAVTITPDGGDGGNASRNISCSVLGRGRGMAVGARRFHGADFTGGGKMPQPW